MKLTKEDVYIDLRYKGKKELKTLKRLTGIEIEKEHNYLHFNTYENLNKWWSFNYWKAEITKQEVTIHYLK